MDPVEKSELSDYTKLCKMSLEDIDGIGEKTAIALRTRGINPYVLETTPLKELEDKYGISELAAQKYQNYIYNQIYGGYFVNGYAYYLQKQKQNFFTTGVNSIDEAFAIPELKSYGIRLAETYELFGSFGTGKSQICHQLAVTVQLPREYDGLNKKVVYIDTEGTFSPTRIINIASALIEPSKQPLDTKDFLKNILYARAKNSDIQFNIISKLFDILSHEPDKYGLIIVDSMTALLRAEYSGRGTLAERQQKLNQQLSLLQRIAHSFNVSIVITNQVQSNPAQFFGDPTQAIGGNILGHWANHRCYLRKSKGNLRILRIIDSPVYGENEAVYQITQNGLKGS